MSEKELLAAGINDEGGVKRFAGKAAAYEKRLIRFPENPNYTDMMRAIKQKDYGKAFQCAHTLKGIVGNFSMDKLYECAILLVEALRGGQAFGTGRVGKARARKLSVGTWCNLALGFWANHCDPSMQKKRLSDSGLGTLQPSSITLRFRASGLQT